MLAAMQNCAFFSELVRACNLMVLRFALAICALHPALAAEPITLSAVQVEPWSYIDAQGRPSGIYVDFIAALAQEAGFEQRINLRPYARVLLELQTGDAALGFMLSAPPIDDVAIAATPIHELNLVLMATPAYRIDKLSDLEGKSVAVLSGTSFHAVLGLHDRIRIRPVKSPEQQLLMLRYGRVDAVLGIRETTRFAAQKLNASNTLPPLILRELSVSKLQVRLYISKKHYSSALHERLDKALSRLLARGELERLIAHYRNRTANSGNRLKARAPVQVGQSVASAP